MQTRDHLFDSYLGRTGNGVWDHQIAKYVQERIGDWVQDIDGLHCREEFIDEFQRWIESSTLNRFTELHTFDHRYATLGATQALDSFHYEAKASGGRIKLLWGEYPYNYDVADEASYGDDLVKGDWLIMSVPFSASGAKHPQFEQKLNEALIKGVPVLVDCAWFGTCGNIEIDFSHPGISAVTFSTSKGLSAGNWRAGVCFSRILFGHLAVQNAWDHSVHLNNRISLELLRKFGPDYVYTKYRKAQEAVCEVYGLVPSNCVHIGIGGAGWEHFHRGENGNGWNRVNIRNAVRDMYKTGACRT